MQRAAEPCLHFLEALHGGFVTERVLVDLDDASHLAAGIDHGGKGALFEVGFALHCSDEVRDEVESALVGVLYLRPLRLDAFVEGYNLVVDPDAFRDDDDSEYDDGN